MTSGRRAAPIRFGTSGFRGVLGEGFSEERVSALVAAVALHAQQSEPGGSVLVAHDTRFLADRFAERAARIVLAAGLHPLRVTRPIPTPVASHAVRARRCVAGLVFTASHNPPEYLGLKVVAPDGGAAPRDLTDRLERRAEQLLEQGPPPEAELRGRGVDCTSPYLTALLARLDVGAIRRARIRVFYDALHGTGAGVLDEALRRAGARVAVRRAEPDPRFGGISPDPVAEHLGSLRREVADARGLRLGLASDGDADRYGVVDADGRVLSATEAVALLVDHLARRGRLAGGVAISVATGSLVERVAGDHGLAVERHPIGFRSLSSALVSGAAAAAGEESGGFAWGPATDKDGILAGCLLVECLADARKPLSAALGSFYRRHGRSACGRAAVAAEPGSARALERLARVAPRRFDGVAVRNVERCDGIRLELEDGFLLVRLSGTEPVVRLYAEAPGPRRLSRRLRAGRDWLRSAG